MKAVYLFSLVILLFSFACRNKAQNEIDLSQKSFIACAPITTDAEWYKGDNVAPIIDGLDALHFTTTTKDSLAQKYFDQGLILAYAFNHAEAARSFYYATKLDPEFTMGYWGYAYVLGPNYNAGMEYDNYQRAYDAVLKAQNLVTAATSLKERALIDALSARYVEEPVKNRSKYDIAYSHAMKKVSEQFPNDPDISTLYAESIMNLHPWDLWKDNGEAQNWTYKIISQLQKAMSVDPKHPGAHHFYIHIMEASKEPEKALKSAQLFDSDLVAGAGHLVHMPSHIYIRTGDYHKGTLSNQRAAAVDSSYVASCNAQGAYPLSYFPHNYHFMAATATLEGNSKIALKAAYKVASHANLLLMKEPGWGTLQHYYTIPYYINIKFAKWNDILLMKNIDSTLIYPQAIRSYARGMAFLGLNDLNNSRLELERLQKLAKDPSLKEITIWDINSVDVLLEIAKRVLEAELLAKELNFEKSINLLNEAVTYEDNLNYNEPPDWFFSVRHHLGAIQIEAGKFEDAISTFKEDLIKFPKNGWALHGLQQAYINTQDKDNLIDTSEKLKKAWSTSDVSLISSRLQ
ncbi:hypothetical protein B0O79_2976 [Flavobacteriaceae bacterium MAR_2009_75]|nr:hypothetical protein B0O79_2976 [Flavobacteriaceae bacterium MAR_2009_75]